MEGSVPRGTPLRVRHATVQDLVKGAEEDKKLSLEETKDLLIKDLVKHFQMTMTFKIPEAPRMAPRSAPL